MKLALALLAAGCLCWAQPVHETCAPCHGEQTRDFLTHAHSKKLLSCDVCHGKSEKHRLATGGAPPDRVAAPDEQPAMCGACHPAQRKSFEQSKHGKLLLARAKEKSPACGSCHGVHAARTFRAMETSCTRCHATLPESCRAQPAAAANVRCAGCHDRHLMSVVGKR